MNIFLRRATYSLVFLIAASPLIVSETYSLFVLGKALWFRSLVWALAIILGVLVIKNKKFLPEKNIGFLLLGLFILFQIFSSIFGLNIINSFWGSMSRMSGIMQSIHFLIFSLILFSIFRTKKDWLYLLRIIIFIGLLVSILGFFESFNIYVSNFLNAPFSIKTLSQPFNGISSTLGNPAYVSWYLVIISLLSVALITYEYNSEKNIQENLKNKINYFYIITIIFSLYCLIINFSRGSIISIAIAIVMISSIIFYITKNKIIKILLSSIILIILFSPSILFLIPLVDENLIESDVYKYKYDLILNRIPELKDAEYKFEEVGGELIDRPNFLDRGGRVHLVNNLIGAEKYEKYNNIELEKKILRHEISDQNLCSEDVLFQKWLMGIEGIFEECAPISILLGKIPGNLSKSITQPFNLGDRPMTIKSSISIWQDYPLTGVGPENFKSQYFKVFEFDDYLYSRKLVDDPHNSILKILSELGIAGLLMAVLSYSYIFYISAIKIMKSKNKIFWTLISTILVTYFINSLVQYSSFSNQLVMSFLMAFLIRSNSGFSDKEIVPNEVNINWPIIIYTLTVSVILTISIYYHFLIYTSSSRMVNSTYTIEEYQENVNSFPSLSTEPRAEMIGIINDKFSEIIIDIDRVVKIVDEEYESSLIYHPNYYTSIYEFGLFYYEVSKYKPEYIQRLKEIVSKANSIAPNIKPSLDLKIRESIISGDNEKFKKLYYEWKEKLSNQKIKVYSDKSSSYYIDSGESFFDNYFNSIK